jgi:branched-subunit amino acid aminotransferase/4-amino-4-deoxychorismate lyase
VLPGISLSVLAELADDANISVSQRDLTPLDVAMADEVFLTSTSPCMLPVTRFNGQAIGSGVPGPAFGRFLAAWTELVGLDIVAQAERFASR